MSVDLFYSKCIQANQPALEESLWESGRGMLLETFTEA